MKTKLIRIPSSVPLSVIQEAVSQHLKEHEEWDDQRNWMDITKAKKFVPADVLDLVPAGAKVFVSSGGENADFWMYNNFRGGIHAYINGKWLHLDSEEKAFRKFQDEDAWAS
jgi:hypothetical protein